MKQDQIGMMTALADSMSLSSGPAASRVGTRFLIWLLIRSIQSFNDLQDVKTEIRESGTPTETDLFSCFLNKCPPTEANFSSPGFVTGIMPKNVKASPQFAGLSASYHSQPTGNTIPTEQLATKEQKEAKMRFRKAKREDHRAEQLKKAAQLAGVDGQTMTRKEAGEILFK